jgi:hypothetical protein
VEDINAGLSVPLLRVREDSVATLETRATSTVYVDVVIPSSAVPTTVMVLFPTLSGILALSEPEVTSEPLTRTVAKALVVVGITVMADVVFDTLAV